MWGWQTAFLFRDSQSVCQLRGSMSQKKRKATNQIHQIAEICQVLAVGFRTMFHIFHCFIKKKVQHPHMSHVLNVLHPGTK